MQNQRTIAKEIKISGTGLHTANKVNLVFKPAGLDQGIHFIRVDLANKPVIKANVENLIFPALQGSLRRSSIGKEGCEIYTIEHLMACLSGLGIDNLDIEIDSNEVPGLDGSAKQFVELLIQAGIKEQDGQRQYYIIKEPLSVEEGSASIVLLPYDGFKISYNLNYNHEFLGTQFKEFILNEEVFKNEISPARTFCLEEEAAVLRKQGMGKGADYKNTLVIGKNGPLQNTLRFPDECIRHKILDLMGDFYLFGQPIKGHVIALRSGHLLNLKLVKKIFQQRQKSSQAGIPVSNYTIDETTLDIEGITKILPHREPFLFVDRIIHLEKGKKAVGIKNVTINDYFFRGHFPQKPVMPGVIIIEAMAQVGGIMMLALEENRGKLAFFMSMNNVKFRKTVVPGDQLVFEIIAGKIKSKTGQVFGKALVDGKVVAEAELMFALS